MDIKTEKKRRIYEKVKDFYLNKSMTIEQACKKAKISKQTYYAYRKKFNVQQTGGSEPEIEEKKKSEEKASESEFYDVNKDKKSFLDNIKRVIDDEAIKAGIGSDEHIRRRFC